jgi:hypothetical protein
LVTQRGGSSNEFEEFAQPVLYIQNEQQTEANEDTQAETNKESKNSKQQSNWDITTSELQDEIDTINVEQFFTSIISSISSDDFFLLDEKVKKNERHQSADGYCGCYMGTRIY